MTPQERQLVSDLFDKLARLESTPRDADAERAIADGLQRAPHAIYPLVQTVLLQDEALRRADARLRELEGEPEGAQGNGGFLDQMRDALFGGRSGGTSVPSVRQNLGGDSRWREPTQNAAPAPGGIGAGGGSFLGTAAASAVGVVGGMMMANMIGSLLGGGTHGQAFAGQPQTDRASPWDQQASGSDLARDAGLGDVGGDRGGEARHASLFDSNDDDNNDDGASGYDSDDADFDSDLGGDL